MVDSLTHLFTYSNSYIYNTGINHAYTYGMEVDVNHPYQDTIYLSIATKLRIETANGTIFISFFPSYSFDHAWSH